MCANNSSPNFILNSTNPRQKSQSEIFTDSLHSSTSAETATSIF